MKPAIAALLLMFAATALATTWQVMELEEMLGAADSGFHGTVSDVRGEMRENLPWTLVTFTLEPGAVLAEPLLEDGNLPGSVTLAFLGGSVASGQLVVEGMPVFSTGDEVLVLSYGEEYYSPLVGFSQGLWRLQDGMWRAEDGSVLAVDEDGDLLRAPDGEATEVAARLLEILEAR